MNTPLEEISLKEMEKNDECPNPGNSDSRNFSNVYAAKKNVAQGMMDIALITANANQLRYLLEYGQQSKTFYMVLILIIVSMCIQIIVGIFLIFKSRFELRNEKCEHACRLSNYVVFGLFLITVINVFIAAFSATGSSSITPPHSHE